MYELSILSLLKFLNTLTDFISFSSKGSLFQFLGNVLAGSVFMNDFLTTSKFYTCSQLMCSYGDVMVTPVFQPNMASRRPDRVLVRDVCYRWSCIEQREAMIS